MCKTRTEINYMIQAMFLAAAIQGILLFKVPDMWGSRKSMIVFGLLSFSSQFVILLVPNFQIRIVAFFILGASFIKNSQSYTWLSGFVQQKHIPLCYGVINAYDCLAVLIICLYFIYVSTNYFNLYFYLGTVVCAIAFLLTILFAPESPKFLIGN